MIPPKRNKPAPSEEMFPEGFKIGIYGPEGIGKSSLAALCPGATFADIERSMKYIDVKKATGIKEWQSLREWVQGLRGNIIAGIDSVTRAEDWAAQHVIRNKKSNEGFKATDSLEDFKYKAGLRFVNDEFKKILTDIDDACQRGVSFIMVAHQRVKVFTDPDGSNYHRYEPSLVDDKEISNMRQWVQFLDHLVFVDLDKAVTKGKVTAGGSRTIFLDTSASHISKARGIDRTQIDFSEGSTELWERLGVIK